MKIGQRGRTHAVVLAAALAALLSACGGPKSQDQVDRNVAEAKADAARNMADARKDAVNEITAARTDAQGTIHDANHEAVQAQSDVIKATADAEYKLAMEQAANDHNVALKQCDGLTGDPQKTCRDHANAEFADAQARAAEDRARHIPTEG